VSFWFWFLLKNNLFHLYKIGCQLVHTINIHLSPYFDIESLTWI